MRVLRLSDASEVHALCLANASPEQSVGPLDKVAEWLADPRNVALQYGNDLGLFEYFAPGVYECHCFCRSKGREALRSIKAALDEMGPHTFFGHASADNMGHRWLFRHLGFKRVMEVIRDGEKHIFVVLNGNTQAAQPVK